MFWFFNYEFLTISRKSDSFGVLLKLHKRMWSLCLCMDGHIYVRMWTRVHLYKSKDIKIMICNRQLGASIWGVEVDVVVVDKQVRVWLCIALFFFSQAMEARVGFTLFWLFRGLASKWSGGVDLLVDPFWTIADSHSTDLSILLISGQPRCCVCKIGNFELWVKEEQKRENRSNKPNQTKPTD